MLPRSCLPAEALDGSFLFGSSRNPTSSLIGYNPGLRSRWALIVFFINMATVMGPTPPGTGVIFPATKLTEGK